MERKIEEVIERALAVAKYLSSQQRGYLQNLIMHFELKGGLSEKQKDFLLAITKSGERFVEINMEFDDEEN